MTGHRPQPHHQWLLTHVLGLRVEDLGFVPPWGEAGERRPDRRRATAAGPPVSRSSLVPEAALDDLSAATVAHRRLYWSIDPVALCPVVTEHVRLGTSLLSGASRGARRRLGAALGESALLAGRIEFFDLRHPTARVSVEPPWSSPRMPWMFSPCRNEATHASASRSAPAHCRYRTSSRRSTSSLRADVNGSPCRVAVPGREQGTRPARGPATPPRSTAGRPRAAG
jgi:hypothetical protein